MLRSGFSVAARSRECSISAVWARDGDPALLTSAVAWLWLSAWITPSTNHAHAATARAAIPRRAARIARLSSDLGDLTFPLAHGSGRHEGSSLLAECDQQPRQHDRDQRHSGH